MGTGYWVLGTGYWVLGLQSSEYLLTIHNSPLTNYLELLDKKKRAPKGSLITIQSFLDYYQRL